MCVSSALYGDAFSQIDSHAYKHTHTPTIFSYYTKMAATEEEFRFPSIYEFPPFYTKQPNEQTWKSQLSSWDSLILNYCKHYKIWTLDLQPDQELFWNKKINRKLKTDSLKDVFNYMVKQGHAEWNDSTTVLIYFKTPTEWANEINQWINDSGQNGTVLTLYELSEGDSTVNQSFHGIHHLILKKALDILAGQNKAVWMKGSDNKIAGVKML